MQRAIGISTLLAVGLVGLLMAAAQVPVTRSSPPARPVQAGFLPPPRKHMPPPDRPRPPRGTWLALVYAGNGNGEIEPCG